LSGDSEFLGNSGTHVWVDLVEVSDHDFLDALSALSERAANVGHPVFSVGLREDLSPESSWLLVVVVRVGVSVSSDVAVEFLWAPLGGWVLNWSAQAVWLVVDVGLLVSSDGEVTVSLIVMKPGSVWAVNWDLLIVSTESMSVGVWVGEESSLEHLVVGWFDSWDQMRWGEGGLLSLSVVVLWVSVQGHLSNLDEWVVTVWPDLGDVKNIESVVVSVFDWHDLNVPSPGWVVSLLDSIMKIPSSPVLVL